MMKGKRKFIGINQRIPFKVLNDGIIRLLQSGEVSLDEFRQDMGQYSKGKNRIKKASKYAMQTISRPAIIKTIQSKFDAETFNHISEADRKAMILCLLALTYPIIYDMLVSLSSVFKVQPHVNRSTINSKMSALYGSNRTLDIAIDAVIPMIIELGTIKRTKVSIYEIEAKKPIKNPFISELYIYTDIKLSGSKTILPDDLQFRPWYMYFEPVLNLNKMTILNHSEGRVGGGYVGVK
jgi:hypothetical protein